MRFMVRDGDRVCVVRPSRPSVPIELTERAVKENNAALFARLPLEAEDEGVVYRFVGYASKQAKQLLNARGKVIGFLQPGDSFVGLTCHEHLGLGETVNFHAREDLTMQPKSDA